MSTNFPNGLMSYGIPVLGSGMEVPTTTGSYFFVDSNTGSDSSAHGSTPDKAFATIDYAIGNCTANKGDVIIAMPGHTETLTGAGQLTFDVAGVTLVGLGTGTLRPNVIQDTATTADVDITAANVTIRNILFTASFADVAASIDLDAANCWFDNCEWEQEGANLNWVDVIVTGADNVCDGLKITNCRSMNIDTLNDGFLNCVGDIDGLVFTGNHIQMGVSGTEPVVEVTGKSLTSCLITHNYIARENIAGAIFVDSDQTDNDGIVAFNTVFCLDPTGATPFDVTGAGLFENYSLGAVDASGLLLPAVDDNA